MRPDRSGVSGAMAECYTCGWTGSARNAVGLAAQHAKRTGHEVVAEQVISMIWNPT